MGQVRQPRATENPSLDQLSSAKDQTNARLATPVTEIRHRDRPGRQATTHLDVAQERLGIAPENLEPYGHYKAKVSMDYIKSLKGKKNGKLILVTAITPTPAGEGKTTTTVGLTDALNHIGKKAMLCLREPSLGPSLRHEGRRRRRRLRPGGADGGHQPPLHRRFPRHHLGAQPALGTDRQPHLLGQRARHRQPPRRLAPRDGHERSRASRDRLLARRRRQRLSARGRLRHHRRLRGDGDLLPCQRSRRPQGAGSATSSSATRASANRCAPAISRRTAP